MIEKLSKRLYLYVTFLLFELGFMRFKRSFNQP